MVLLLNLDTLCSIMETGSDLEEQSMRLTSGASDGTRNYIVDGIRYVCANFKERTRSGSPIYADMAQVAEHVLGKDEVTGSNPVISSKKRSTQMR